MDRVGEKSIRGCPQATAVLLRSTAEVTPTEVGICAMGHPGIRGIFGSVQQALREAFIWDLFQGLGEGTPVR